MNAEKLAELAAHLAHPRYRPLIDQPEALADLINVRSLTTQPNPMPQGFKIVPPGRITEIIPYLTNAEKGAITSKLWRTLQSELYAQGDAEITVLDQTTTVGDLLDQIAIALLGGGASGVYVDEAGQILISASRQNPVLLIGYLALLRLAGLISPSTHDAIMTTMLVSDPTWSDTIYIYGDSIATVNNWQRVTPADVTEAMA